MRDRLNGGIGWELYAHEMCIRGGTQPVVGDRNTHTVLCSARIPLSQVGLWAVTSVADVASSLRVTHRRVQNADVAHGSTA